MVPLYLSIILIIIFVLFLLALATIVHCFILAKQLSASLVSIPHPLGKDKSSPSPLRNGFSKVKIDALIAKQPFDVVVIGRYEVVSK